MTNQNLINSVNDIKDAAQGVENCITSIIDHCKKELTDNDMKYLRMALKGIRMTILNLDNTKPRNIEEKK